MDSRGKVTGSEYCTLAVHGGAVCTQAVVLQKAVTEELHWLRQMDSGMGGGTYKGNGMFILAVHGQQPIGSGMGNRC